MADRGAPRPDTSDMVANLLAFLEVHHYGEDQLVVPVLRDRAPTSHALVSRMGEQHIDVHGRLPESKEAVALWSEGAGEGDDRVVATLGGLGEALTGHLDEEEEELLPLAGAYLSMGESAYQSMISEVRRTS
jgi:hemerythrin-like domain-containing protein